MTETARRRILLAALGLWFLAAALTARINHDESQYVAAIGMMRVGLPFRDWPFLQTPLQPLLLSPLSLLPAGWLLVAARLANVLFAVVTCWALLRLLKDRVPFWAAAAATVAMATTNAFLFGTEVARNDMLPAALLALALLAFLPLEGLPGWRRTLLGGLCLGLAISAKISMAVPAAGVGLWLLWRVRRVHRAAVFAAAAGGIAGLLPTLILYAFAPERFLFGVFEYSLIAPQQFWTSIGEGERLAPLVKLGGIALEMIEGPTLAAILLTLVTLRERAQHRLLEIVALGGLLAAYLPDPFFRQYMVPLLPALFARAGLALPTVGERIRLGAFVLGAVTAVIGAAGTVANFGRALLATPPLFEAVERGRIVARTAAGGTVVTLAPEQLAGSDVALHPGFAAGPFLFRIHGREGQEARQRTGAPTFEELAVFDRAPPAVVMTGSQRRARPPFYPRGLDHPLDRWAAGRGYVAVALPGEGWWMWVRPSAGRAKKKGGPAGPPSNSRSRSDQRE